MSGRSVCPSELGRRPTPRHRERRSRQEAATRHRASGYIVRKPMPSARDRHAIGAMISSDSRRELGPSPSPARIREPRSARTTSRRGLRSTLRRCSSDASGSSVPSAALQAEPWTRSCHVASLQAGSVCCPDADDRSCGGRDLDAAHARPPTPRDRRHEGRRADRDAPVSSGSLLSTALLVSSAAAGIPRAVREHP